MSLKFEIEETNEMVTITIEKNKQAIVYQEKTIEECEESIIRDGRISKKSLSILLKKTNRQKQKNNDLQKLDLV